MNIVKLQDVSFITKCPNIYNKMEKCPSNGLLLNQFPFQLHKKYMYEYLKYVIPWR